MSSPPVWSIGTSQRSNDLKADAVRNPGPGAYNPDVSKISATPCWRIGTARRSIETKVDTPGPGAYDSPGKLAKGTPKYHFGIKTVTNEKFFTPGPGTYDTNRIRGSEKKPPSYSIAAKGESSMVNRTDSPGPGAYDQESRILNQRAATMRFGSSKRSQLHNLTNIPGPGAYSLNLSATAQDKNGPKWGFGTSDRNDSFLDTSLPGPGAYNSVGGIFDDHKKGVSIIPRRPDSAIVDNTKLPGPGAYTPSLVTKKRAPGFRMGSAPRSHEDREQLLIPGPGNYNPQPPKKNSNVRIGTSRRKPLNESFDFPGPGAYKVDLSTNHGPKYIIIPRRDDVSQAEKRKQSPGPGAYNPTVEQVKQSNPRYRIGSARRESFGNLDLAPGPGAYDIKRRIEGPKFAFGKEQRSSSLLNNSEDPGPGAYNIPPKFANVPRYALGGSVLKGL